MMRSQTFVVPILLGVLKSSVQLEKPDLYYFLLSPPCRTVLMTAKVLDVDLNLILMDVSQGKQFAPEYLAQFPQHTVPALNDNGFTLSESRAIASYLTTLTPKGEKLYPKDPKKRAVVDQMMYFDLDKMYPRMLRFYVYDADATPMVFGAPFDQTKAEKLNAAFNMLEQYLTKTSWAAGDDMTIADITLLTTVSMAEACGYNVSQFPKVDQWLTKMKSQIPDYKALNEEGIEMWKNASLNIAKVQ